MVTTFYTLVGILSILFSGVALDIITCRPPSLKGRLGVIATVHLSVADTRKSYQTCRDRRPRRSKVVSVTAARSSVAQKRDLQEPSLVREGGRQTELAECRLTDE